MTISDMAATKRFYVGNLFAEVTEADLEKLFSKFGSVDKVEIKTKTDVDGNVMTTFAFVTLSQITDESVAKCIQQYNNLKWKKQVIKVQQAQESFLNRLQKEREEAIKANFEKAKDYNPLALVKKAAEESQAERKKRFYDSSDEEEENKPVKRPALKPTFGQNPTKPTLGQTSIPLLQAIKAAKSSKKADEKASVSFLDDEGAKEEIVEPKGGNKLEFENRQKRVYHSSSEDEEDEDAKRPPKKAAKPTTDVLAQLETFNSDFWNDEGGFGKPNQKVTLEGPFGLKKPADEESQAKPEDKSWMNKSVFAQAPTQTTGFSLLSKFSGAKADEIKEEEDKTELVDSFALKLKEKVATEASGGKIEPFFFKPNDPRFSECSTFLTLKQQSFDELRTKYEVARPVLASIMKKKLKNRAKKQEKLSFGTKTKQRKFNGKKLYKKPK